MNQEEFNFMQAQSAFQGENIQQQQLPSMPQLHEQMQQNQAILVAQTDPKKIIKEIILRLEGKEELNDGSIIKVGDPLINEIGIRKIKFILDSHINDNVRLSHLERHDISRRMEILGSDLVDNLTLNNKLYGIKNKTDLDDINNAVLCNIFDVLKRAEGQGEKNWLGKISVEQISGGQRIAPPKKGGVWEKFKL